MYKQDLELDNLQWLICHKTKPNQIESIQRIGKFSLSIQHRSLLPGRNNFEDLILRPSPMHHHHHDVRLVWISLTLFLHVSLSFIAFGRSSGLHPVSSHSCCMNVRAGRPAFDWPYAGVHRSTSLTISSLLLQQCPACLVRLACIVS